MPLMVDDQQMMDNIDDLFGDGDNEGLNAALAATLDSDTLRQRIEESHIIGCCRKLAWSRAGCVAHITDNGRKITFRAMIRDKATGKSLLSDEGQQSIVAHGDVIFTHIDWSTSGTEIVVTDQFGRLYLHSMALAMNRIMPNTFNNSVPHHDLSAVVGLHWLALNMGPRPIPIITPATKDGGRWQSGMAPYKYETITHPTEGKSAFVCVTRSNQVKLVYQQTNQPWSEVMLELGELTSSSDVITHASFGDAPGQLLLITHDASQCLRLYRVNILWNHVQGDFHHGIPPSVNPVLRVTHVQLLDHVIPQSQTAAELSQILVQAPAIGADKGHISIMALFTCLPDDQQTGHQASERGSIIAKWELKQSEVVLHDVFKTLKPGFDKPAPSKARETLQRQADIFTSKIYLFINDNLYHNVLNCASSDGTVDFRYRDSMEIIMAVGDSNTVSSLAQAGFAYAPSECTDIVLSPCGCVAAIGKHDGSVHLHTAEFLHGWGEEKNNMELAEAAVVALAREVGILFCHTIGSDDILALIPTDLDQALRRKLMAEVLRTIARNTDFTGEDAAKDKAKVLKDSMLFKFLSLQLVLGYDTNPGTRDITGKVAWLMLNLRSLSQNTATSMSMNAGPSVPDLMISLRGLAKWNIDLMHFVIDDLFTILRASRQGDAKITKEFLTKQIAATRNTPAVHLILQSASRHLFRFSNDMTMRYFQRAIASKPLARDLSQRAALQEIEALVQNHIAFKIPVFEQLLLEIDSAVRKAYAEAGVDARGRAQIEQAMLVEAEIPDVLLPVLETLFGTLLPKFGERVDGVKIFSTQTAWVGAGDESGNEQDSGRGGRIVDVVRKVDVSKGAKIRKCRRCGSLVEDLWEERGLMPWIYASQRSCVCLSHWVI